MDKINIIKFKDTITKYCKNNYYVILNYFFLVVVFILGLIIRISLFPKSSGDLNVFISWYRYIQNNGGFKALSTLNSDYQPMYHYFLWLMSLTKLPAITAVKLISVIFDVIISIYVMKIIELKEGKNSLYAAIAFAITFCLPTVIHNSSFWGQCDVIYTSFFIMFLYYFIKGNDRIAMIMVGLSFSFKLQSVFIFPLVGILVFLKKIRWRMLLWIPIVYIISLFPEALSGKGFMQLLSLYKSQSGMFSLLTLGLPNIWTLLIRSDKLTSTAGIYFSMVVILSMMYYYISNKNLKITKNTIVGITTLTAFIVPFVLPHMHERYYFFVEIMIVILGLYYRKTAFLILLSQWISMQFYYVYLYRIEIIDRRIMTLLWIIIATVVFYTLQKEIAKPTDNEEIVMKHEIRLTLYNND